MAQFVTITDTDGNILRISPNEVTAIYPYSVNPTFSVVTTSGGGGYVINDTVANLAVIFGATLTVNGTVNIGTMPEVEIKNDSGNPIPVNGTINIGTMPEVEIKNDSGNPVPVNGTISLSAATLAALESITVQNGAGAAAVNIQDGGNSITVDGTVATTVNTFSYFHSTGTGAAQTVKVGTGILHGIIFRDNTNNVLVYDDPGTGTTNKFIELTNIDRYVGPLDIAFTQGLRISVQNAKLYTVIYS